MINQTTLKGIKETSDNTTRISSTATCERGDYEESLKYLLLINAFTILKIAHSLPEYVFPYSLAWQTKLVSLHATQVFHTISCQLKYNCMLDEVFIHLRIRYKLSEPPQNPTSDVLLYTVVTTGNISNTDLYLRPYRSGRDYCSEFN